MVSLNINLPNDFLNEEVRCGYLITREMKKVWAVELDLLAEFNRVCKKYHINYCADAGTLLGAIRHNGFIPWDNDIDLAMTRAEYEKLCKVAPQEFKEPYFFQTEETDPGTVRCHAQLRNSQTTGMLIFEKEMGCRFNQGIFLDIFPFDAVPLNKNELIKFYNRLYKKKKKLHSIMWNYKYFYPHIKKKKNGKFDWQEGARRFLKHIQYQITKPDYKKVFEDFNRECQKYNLDENTNMIAAFCLLIGMDRIQRFREDFDDLIEVDFEFLKIPVFRQYDRDLKILYGPNYMTPIQAETVHGNIFFDAEKPYTKYLN